jgi:hypothetical protein
MSIKGVTSVSQVSCGQSHAALVSDRGRVFTWGSGDYGMLGHGTRQSVSVPKLVAALSALVTTSVSCGAFHTAFIACEESEISYLRIPPPKRYTAATTAAGATMDGVKGRSHQISSPLSPTTYSSSSSHHHHRDGDDNLKQAAGETEEDDSDNCSDDVLTCGYLYTCGLGKAGQLGYEVNNTGGGGSNSNNGFAATPRRVVYFEEEGYKVCRVSCGFHHTLAIATPIHAVRTFITHVFSFGYVD